jgi:rare lipoprotein A
MSYSKKSYIYNNSKNVMPLLLLISLLITHCVERDDFNFQENGIASYYHNGLNGKITASGEFYYQDSLTAAHRSLPFGTRVLVERVSNRKKIWVTINDRGPFVRNRIIDLSKRAADSLGMINKGLSKVKIKAVVSKDFLEEVNDQK